MQAVGDVERLDRPAGGDGDEETVRCGGQDGAQRLLPREQRARAVGSLAVLRRDLGVPQKVEVGRVRHARVAEPVDPEPAVVQRQGDRGVGDDVELDGGLGVRDDVERDDRAAAQHLAPVDTQRDADPQVAQGS